MPTTLEAHAVERSTFAITASFTDDAGDPVTPNTGLNWTLTDVNGTVINSRDAVTITPGTSMTIVLSGADLAHTTGADQRRVVTVEGTYDSSLGTGMPLKDQVTFIIDPLVAVP